VRAGFSEKPARPHAPEALVGSSRFCNSAKADLFSLASGPVQWRVQWLLQFGSLKWLSRKLDGAGLHGAETRRNVTCPVMKMNRRCVAAGQYPAELEAIGAWQLEIQDETAGRDH